MQAHMHMRIEVPSTYVDDKKHECVVGTDGASERNVGSSIGLATPQQHSRPVETMELGSET